MSPAPDERRHLPSVERLLSHPSLRGAWHGRRDTSVQLAREALARARSRVQAGATPPEIDQLAREVAGSLAALCGPPVRRVINATGVVLHTNLGRAPLAPSALRAVDEVGRGFSNLEFDLERGQRGSRHDHITDLIRRLTGAEAALVVNNNAAAVLLALTALAAQREVIISRGELVEIGGGFRVPDVLRQSGARLVEVGTTNRTYVGDYEAAITSETAVLLRVHSSNFKVTGFTHRPELTELVGLARARGVPVVEDLGSGTLLDTAQFGLAREPMVQESVVGGVDLVCFSGDKLLGGPQAGIIVGRDERVQRLKRHPLTRALRPDKLTIAALAATLAEYLSGEALATVPIWRMIAAPLAEIEARSRRIVHGLDGAGALCAVVSGASPIGGGSLPGETLPTRLIAVTHPDRRASELARRLRWATPPVVGFVERDRLLLDLRTVDPAEDCEISGALQNALGSA